MNQPETKASGITEMLREWSDGKPEVLDKLLPLVYDELHRQAARFLRKERQGHTLQTTALINEAYLKLIEQRSAETATLLSRCPLNLACLAAVSAPVNSAVGRQG